jgi:hypothetical protein
VFLLAGLVLGACATMGPVEPPAPRSEVWVDAYAPEGGDGSRARPWKRLPPRIPAGVWLHLASGLYRGPIALEPGAGLTGAGTAVVYVEGPGEVVSATDARLETLSVQGGTVGLVARGRVEVEQVHFSGHRGSAARVEPGARASFRRVEVSGTLGTDGVTVEGGEVDIVASRFRGGLRRAVSSTNGAARLDSVSSEGPSTLLWGLDSRLSVEKASAAGGRAAAVFAKGGSLAVRGLFVVGHEYALHAVEATLDAKAITSRGSQLGGIAVERCTGKLGAVTVEGAGALGGVQLLDSVVAADDVEVKDGAALGLLVRRGTVSLDRIQVSGIRAEGTSGGEPALGDAVHVREAVVRAGRIEVHDVEGTGLVAAASSSVSVDSLWVQRAGAGGAAVERGSTLEARRLEVSGGRGPALFVGDGARASVEHLLASGSEPPVWAECAQGAEVLLGALDRLEALPPSRCIRALQPRAGGGRAE